MSGNVQRSASFCARVALRSLAPPYGAFSDGVYATTGLSGCRKGTDSQQIASVRRLHSTMHVEFGLLLPHYIRSKNARLQHISRHAPAFADPCMSSALLACVLRRSVCGMNDVPCHSTSFSTTQARLSLNAPLIRHLLISR